jgi:hypothetical protein
MIKYIANAEEIDNRNTISDLNDFPEFGYEVK